MIKLFWINKAHANIKEDETGLVSGHAYTISGVARVQHCDLGLVNILRIRNPWGNDIEWSGGWGDR